MNDDVYSRGNVEETRNSKRSSALAERHLSSRVADIDQDLQSRDQSPQCLLPRNYLFSSLSSKEPPACTPQYKRLPPFQRNPTDRLLNTSKDIKL